MLSATSQQEMIFVKYFTPAYFPLSRHLPNILPAWFYKSAACYAYDKHHILVLIWSTSKVLCGVQFIQNQMLSETIVQNMYSHPDMIFVKYFTPTFHNLDIYPSGDSFTMLHCYACYKYHTAVLIWSATKVLCGGSVGEECLLIIILTRSDQIPQYHRLTAVFSFWCVWCRE